MHKRDYIIIAALLLDAKQYLPVPAYAKLVTEFCKLLHADNPNFDHARFLKACGWENA